MACYSVNFIFTCYYLNRYPGFTVKLFVFILIPYRIIQGQYFNNAVAFSFQVFPDPSFINNPTVRRCISLCTVYVVY